MSRQPVVVVLHDGEMPSESSMAPVVERAREVRYATAAELPDYVERVVRAWDAGREPGESFAAWAHRADEEALR